MILQLSLTGTLLLACIEAEDPIRVKAKIPKYADSPQFCHREGKVEYDIYREESYPVTTSTYAQIVKCGVDPECKTLFITYDMYRNKDSLTGYVITKGPARVSRYRPGNYGDTFRRQEGDNCPEGYHPYEPPAARFSKLFCKYEDRICTTREKIGHPIKTKNAYFCMKKCIAEPSCSAVAYINNEAIEERCQLLEGHCRTEDLRHFHNGDHYGRLLTTEKECPNLENLKPFCDEGYEKVVSAEFGSDNEQPTAECPDNHVLTRCECDPGNFGVECKGTRMTFDGKSCIAFKNNNPGHLRALACCRPVQVNERVTVISAPAYRSSVEGGYTTAEHSKITCPEHMRIIGCSGYKDSRDHWRREQTLDNRDRFTVNEEERTCGASLVKGNVGIQGVCIGTHEMGAVRTGLCLETETQVESTEVVASCESGSFVSQCSCEVVSGDGFCAGTVVSADAINCQAYGYADGVTVKTTVCCAPLTKGEAAVVMSEPESLTAEVKTDKLSQAPYILCPAGTQLVSCSLYSSVEGQKTYVEGSRCWTAWTCTSCGIQAICRKVIPEPEGPWKCDEGDEEVVSEESTTSTDSPVSAPCAAGKFVSKCTCKPVSEGAYCDFVGVKDNKCEVKTHWFYSKDNLLKARGCCRVQKDNEVISVRSSIVNWEWFQAAPRVTCPEGSEVVSCILHTSPPADFTHERAMVEGASCFAASTCTNCAVIAICSKTFEKITFDKRECADGETEVVSSDMATNSATHVWGTQLQFATATCPPGHWLAHCQCLAQSEDGICDAVRITDNGRGCLARGTVGGAKAKGCCTRVSGRVEYQVVTAPGSYYQSPSIACPDDTTLVDCLIYSKYDTTAVRVPYTHAGSDKCFSGPECTKCGITAICKGIKSGSPKPKCTKFEKEVIVSVENKEKTYAATCEDGYYVRSCSCEGSHGTKCRYHPGTSISADGRTCYVYNLFRSVPTKAKACCAKLRKNEDVFGISDPTRMLSGTQDPVYNVRAPFVECPPKTTLIDCYLRIKWTSPWTTGSYDSFYYKEMILGVTKTGNRCEAPFGCRECGLTAVCKGGKKLVAKLRY